MNVIVSYSVTRELERKGFSDVGLAWALGLRRLGHDVYVFQEVQPKACYDERFQEVPFLAWEGRNRFETLLRRYGLWPNGCLMLEDGSATHGMDFAEALRVARDSELLVLVGGRFRNSAILDAVGQRAYVDINPAKTQVFSDVYSVDYGFDAFDFFFTVGLNIGSESCPIPTGERVWRGVVPPVVLDLWPSVIDERCKRYTSVSTWAGRRTFEFRGKQGDEKSNQWLRFARLPELSGRDMELALKVGPGYDAEVARLRDGGWTVSDPSRFRSLEEYRAFVSQSRAEFSVAHGRYTDFNTGWVSDRTVRYLATGKPALVQRTGIEERIPTGKGLLTFATLDDALEGLEEIEADYLSHCTAARSIAEEYADSDKVLRGVLEVMGL